MLIIANKGPVHFVVRTAETGSLGGDVKAEYLVEASVPQAGGDSAVLAVFDSQEAADLLAAVLQHASDLYGATPAYRNTLPIAFV